MVYQLSDYSNKNAPKTSDRGNEWANILPPQAIDAEEAILGAILLDPDAITRVIENLKASDFYIGKHRIIYEAMVRCHLGGRPPDPCMVVGELSDRNQLTAAGGQGAIAQLIAQTVHSVHVDLHAKLVIAKARRRRIIEICSDLSQQAHTAESDPEIMALAERYLFELTQQQQTAKGLRPLSEFLITESDEIERIANGGEAPGYQTGFYDLDSLLNGLQPGRLYIVAGRPGMGKSAFMGSVIRNVAERHNKPCALFSLEMQGGEVARRLLSAESQIEASRLMTGRLTQDQWEPMGQAMASLATLPIFVDDSTLVTPQEVRSQCLKLKAQHDGLACIVVDYLHLMIDGEGDETKLLDQYCRAFKRMAGELNVPVIVLSQLSRGVESRSNKRPVMSDLRQSGGIEQSADVIAMLYRDEYYNPDTVDRGIVEVIIAKHRNGPVGTVKLLFEPQFTRFRNLARGAS